MIPIFEQVHSKGIGYNFDSFLDRFNAICHEHINTGRARAFAFIFYDFQDKDFKKILKNEGVFAKLDRLSGSNLSLFYLHTSSRNLSAQKRFNSVFIKVLGVAAPPKLPCVTFFRVKGDQVHDVKVAEVEHSDLFHGFQELYSIVEKYIANQATPLVVSEVVVTGKLDKVKEVGKFICLEAFRAALKSTFDRLL